VELAASLAGDSALAGAYGLTSGSGLYELQFGIGAAAAEVAISSLIVDQANPANTGLNVILLPVPVDGLASGSRLAVRARRNGGASTVTVAALLYQGITSDHVTTAAQPHTYLPYGTAGVALTPVASSWGNSAWVELTAGDAAELAIAGITLTAGTVNVQWEVDLGTGAASAETVITTLRSDTAFQLGFTNRYLPAALPVAAGTRIAARFRKSDASATGTWLVSLLYLHDTALLTPVAVATAATYVWGPI